MIWIWHCWSRLIHHTNNSISFDKGPTMMVKDEKRDKISKWYLPISPTDVDSQFFKNTNHLRHRHMYCFPLEILRLWKVVEAIVPNAVLLLSHFCTGVATSVSLNIFSFWCAQGSLPTAQGICTGAVPYTDFTS